MITAVAMEITVTIMLMKILVMVLVVGQLVVVLIAEAIFTWQQVIARHLLVKPKLMITVLTTTLLGVRLTMISFMLLVLRVQIHFPLSTERTPVLVVVDMMVYVV